MPIRDAALRICRKQWTIGRCGERVSGISVLIARHDDDDDSIFEFLFILFGIITYSGFTGLNNIYIYIYIYTLAYIYINIIYNFLGYQWPKLEHINKTSKQNKKKHPLNFGYYLLEVVWPVPSTTRDIFVTNFYFTHFLVCFFLSLFQIKLISVDICWFIIRFVGDVLLSWGFFVDTFCLFSFKLPFTSLICVHPVNRVETRLTVSACKEERLLAKKGNVLGLRLNCIWRWGINSRDVRGVYTFIAMTPTSTRAWIGSTCFGPVVIRKIKIK